MSQSGAQTCRVLCFSKLVNSLMPNIQLNIQKLPQSLFPLSKIISAPAIWEKVDSGRTCFISLTIFL